MTEALHRQLITRLEHDRARMLAAADTATVDEVRIAQSGIAAGYLHAIALTLRTFEGPDAVQAYLRQHADGQHLTAHDGPTVREAAADDRTYWNDKYAGDR
ncbi:hypothetical protein ACIRLA_22170 [Streptomyces sp. NPDC102364]|uniref:hypothetical protein n=1 Tax=Streptomyces sp. NPDC102364 TaxID=3366161 RepID=UPI00380D43B6